jgi:hypothetical protein
MTPADFEAKEVDVMKTETIHTLRQAIRVPEQVSVPRVLEAMWAVMRRGKFTGHFTVHMNQGGVRGIESEQILSKDDG